MLSYQSDNMPEKYLNSKYTLAVLTIIFLFVVIALGRESYSNYKINQEIGELQEKIDAMQKSNNDFAEMEKYFQSEEFLEKEAKLKLNLVREGEKLIIIKQEENPMLNAQNLQEQKNISNPAKWWNFFFSK